MKQLLRFKTFLILALLAMVGNSAWAQSTSTLTFSAKCNGSGTADDGVSWTVTSDGSESNFDSNKGIHYGTGSQQVQYIKLSTSQIVGTITSVVVNASTASGVSATVDVTVGGEAFGGNPQSLSASAANYTFNGSASGKIVVTVTKPSKATKAIYVKSVAVTYTSGGSSTLDPNDLALTGAPVALSFDLYNNATPQVVNYTTSSTGAVTIADNDYATFVVDQTNKTITVTPTAVTPSTQTVMVVQDPDETYASGFVTFTFDIADTTPSDETWEATALADLTADDVFVIVGNNGNNFALANDNGTGSAPSAVGVTVSDGKITSKVSDNIKWTVSGDATNGYTFYPAGSTETWLYCTATNNGVRVGTNDNKTFTVSTEGYLKHSGTNRYLGVYNSQDWRCYTEPTANNIKDQTFTFYRYVDPTVPQKTNPELAFAETKFTINLGDAFTAPALTFVEGFDGTVTYESSNTAVATVGPSGIVTIEGAGTTTITASSAETENYRAATASYTLTVVDPNGPGTENNPYTVAEARAAIDAGTGMTGVYAKGIVSEIVTAYNSQYGNITYNISADGTTTADQLQAYRGKSYNGESFTSVDDIQVGDEVVVYGNLKKYGETYEFDANNQLVSLKRPVVTTPSITIDPATYTMDAKAGGGEIPVVSENLASDPQLAVVFVEADGVTPATYDWISATINADGNIVGAIQANTGDARTAYFYVTGKDANGNTVQSNLVTFTQEAPVAATPTIVFNPESIDFDANGGSKTIGGDYFQLKDFDSTPSLEILYYESDGDTEKQGGYDWLTADFNSNNQIDFTWGTNTGAARTAYLKIHAVGTTVYSNLFTVNQAAAATPDVAHYYQKVSSSADLTNGDYLIVCEEGNVAFNGGLETLDAVSNTIEVKIADHKIASSETVDAAVFTIDTEAGTLLSASGLYIGQTTDGNGMKSSAETPYENTLQVDTDGNADIESAGAYLRYNAASNQERFRYYKSSSYTGQKVIQLYKRMDGEMPAASPALAVTPDVVTVPYTGGADSFTVTPSNVENAIGGYVTFYDPTDTETTVDQPKWIGISYDYSNMSLSYTITDENNTGAERTACFKYFIMCDNGGAMSNLVTVKQEAYVAPVASIAVDPNVVNATSVATEGTIDVTYNNITTVVSEVKFYDADGTTEATYDWIEAEIDANNNVYYVIDENNGVARTAYLKVYALDDDANDVYSELITINQAAYVAPALTQINLTKTLVFDTDCGLASGGYAVNDELTELSGTFEGDASATRFGGFVIKDSYINGGSIQMKANTGSIAFPAIESEYGFDVTVAYKTNDAIVYISGVSSTEASSGIAHLIIATGSKYCQITSITLTPKTSEVPPTVDVEEPVITAADGLVEIIPGADNVQVIYTTDGTEPTYEPLNGTVYTEPFNITVDSTVKAIGVDNNGNVSDVVELSVTAPVVSGVKYYKVTSTDQLEEGVDYLLVYEGEAGEGAAAYGGLNSYTGYSIGKSVALKHIGGSVVTITDEEVVPVTLKSRSEDGTKWAMRDATGWIAAVNGYNNLHGDKTEDDAIWTFDFTADANKQIFQEFTATSTRYLQYNTSSPRFAGYTGTQSVVYLYKAATYNVSVGATGYATLYYGTKNLVVPENVEAYTYTVNNGKLEESYLYSTNEVIPAGTGVVLKAPAGEYKFAVTTEAGLEDTDNLLFGFDTPSKTVAPAAGDYLFYLLGVDNGKVGFYWGKTDGAAFKSGAHKAYLAVPTEQASGLRGFSFDGSVVGINTIGVDMPEGNAYDLQGRRVQQLQKNGLYIVDGKKMLAK